MKGKCTATNHTREVSDSTATTVGGLGIEYFQAFCPVCDKHHEFMVLHGREVL